MHKMMKAVFLLPLLLHFTAVWASDSCSVQERLLKSILSGAAQSCPPRYVLLTVMYSLEFPNSACQPARGTAPPGYVANVTVPAGSTALDVMEAAAGIDSGFNFKGADYGPSLGFGIHDISGTRNSNSCYWLFYVTTADGSNAQLSPVGPSHFSICSETEIIWQYGPF